MLCRRLLPALIHVKRACRRLTRIKTATAGKGQTGGVFLRIWKVRMDINRFTWALVLVLIVAPIVVVGILRFFLRKRGGLGSGWGGALFVTLCWVVALLAILAQVHS